ncbi:MAG: CBS domain-containing protein [Acidiferrobacterales bacterium]|nr:CBS domain-containing protein [Gammaproteobacteria bacterium]
MKHIPLIKSVMTAFPYFIEVDAGLKAATQMMERHGIRHLPVKDGDQLIGVVSDRDIKRAKRELHVSDIVVRETYIVNLTERLDSVLLHLAQRHIGCALVVKEGRLAGIFTTTDACRVFGEYLRSLFPTEPGDDVA